MKREIYFKAFLLNKKKDILFQGEYEFDIFNNIESFSQYGKKYLYLVLFHEGPPVFGNKTFYYRWNKKNGCYMMKLMKTPEKIENIDWSKVCTSST